MFILYMNVLGDWVDSIFVQIAVFISVCFAFQWSYVHKQYFNNTGIAFWCTDMFVT